MKPMAYNNIPKGVRSTLHEEDRLEISAPHRFRSNMDFHSGVGLSPVGTVKASVEQPHLHTFMLTIQEPHDTITAALATLPAFERSVVIAYFIDGDPIGRIMRRYKLKRREVVAAIESALAAMRNTLRSRGIRAVADVI